MWDWKASGRENGTFSNQTVLPIMLQYPSLQLKVQFRILKLCFTHLGTSILFLVIMPDIDYFHKKEKGKKKKKKNHYVLPSAFCNVKLGILEVTIILICSLNS